MVDQRFYFEFEQKYRGTRAEVGKRLLGYSPLLDALEASGLPNVSVDYGCGRGEWLEILSHRGWDATGVDSNVEMLRPAELDGLKIVVSDAIAHIKSLPDASLSLVTGFHIVEHLPVDILHDLIAESFRVLAPGGMIIFETPNPENFLVGSNRFYMDPTHIHPLPPNYLKFIAEFSGFADVYAIGINQPSLRFTSGIAGALLELTELFPDYSVIAQKAHDDPSFQKLSDVVDKDFNQNSPYSYLPLDRLIDRMHALEHNLEETRSALSAVQDELVTIRRNLPKEILKRRVRKIRTFLRF
ncbi:class I SAM-dependent methyltransferase [Agrobacterium genomosp. 13]|uniref:Type 11 methyltransferase n=1 Tax=Agrobacterium genomosp. 13 str. CFBP 6927 TaxID=1183428 RepID=A0ABM9VKP2_9HYPH